MVLVGTNGSGKITFFDVFGFLRDCLNHNVRQAMEIRGKFHEVVSRGHEAEDILIEIKLRLLIARANRLVTNPINCRSASFRALVGAIRRSAA